MDNSPFQIKKDKFFHNIFKYIKHMTSAKGNKSSQQMSSDKKIEEIYVCSCRKEYQSFPALYLHNKTKHDITIHAKQKDNMKKKSVWSGNKKKVIYQFASEAESSEDEEQKINYSFKSASSKNAIRLNQTSQSLKKIANEFISDLLGQKINFQGLPAIKTLFSQLIIYISSGKQIVEGCTGGDDRMSSLGKIERIPFYFNSFMTENTGLADRIKMPYQNILIWIEIFSNWMFDKKYCSCLAIRNKQQQLSTLDFSLQK